MGKDLKGKELGRGITQRKDGRYYARFVNRFGNRESIYAATLKEIKAALAEHVALDITKSNVISSNITLDEWYEKWMEIYKIPYIRQNTKIYYEQVYMSKISPVLGKRTLISITKLQITALMNSLKKEGYGWETLNKCKLLLIDIFNKALEDDFVNKNPAKGVRLPLNRPQFNPKALSQRDQVEFLECSSGTFYHNMFVVAMSSGLRPGELFALTENDIDFKNNVIHVTKTLVYNKYDGDEQKEFHIEAPKTECSIRDVPINKMCSEALKKQILQANIIKNKFHINATKRNERKESFDNLLFTTKFRTPINATIYNDAINKVVEEMNLLRDPLEQLTDVSGHTFRHTFATRCFEADIPCKTVQMYLGHATLNMTMNLYTKVMPEKKQDDMKLLDNMMERCMSEDNKIVPFTA